MGRIKIKKETSDRLYWRFGEVFREEIISEQSFAVRGKGSENPNQYVQHWQNCK